MIYDSDTNSDISQNQIDQHFQDDRLYENKLTAIWDNIEKTKHIEPSDNEDHETYQMYKNKRIQQERPSDQKYPNEIQKKITRNLKAKKSQEPKTQQKKTYLKQRNDPSSSENQKKNFSHNNLRKHNELEQKLQKSKQNTNILMKKLIEAEQQIEYLEYELEKEMTDKQQLLIELKTRNHQAETEQKQNRILNSNRNDPSVLESQITIDKYRLRLKAAQKEIYQKNHQFAQLQKQFKNLSAQIQSYQLKTSQNSAQKVTFKGSQLLELNEAYKTIQRMVTLLRSTDEYRLLGNFADEVKNLHFLSRIPSKIKSSLSTIKVNTKTKQKQPVCQHCTQVKINQRLLWTPLLCYKKMLEMKMKHDTLNEQCIEEVLFEMNKLYLSKEDTRVNKLKTFYDSEIEKLKKKTQLTYDQILAKKQIQRLKKQLQTSKKRPNKSSYKKPSDPNIEQKLNKFNNNNSNFQNLRVIGQYEDQLRLKDKEVKLLMERIKLLQSETSSYDKSLYMEGVLWIIDKILEELDTNGDDIREFEDRFRAKMSSASSTQDWIRLFKEFFESVQELNHTLIQKILTIKETTINKMNYAKLS